MTKLPTTTMADHLILTHGDITQSSCDAITNAWNRNFIPYWLLLPQGVAGALRRKAGRAPFREVSRLGLLPLGAAVATGAGELDARWIIHVAALHATWRSSPEAVCLGVTNLFRIASQLGVERLAVPLLGAGTGGVDPRTSLKLIRGAWHDAPQRPPHTQVVVYEAALCEELLGDIGWQEGCDALAAGRFWHAHEHWEPLWRLVQACGAREALQALIQFAAACHKTVQAREEGDAAAMRRGMDALIRSGVAHLDAAGASTSPTPGFAPSTLRASFDALAALAQRWREGDDIADEVARVARECAERLVAEAGRRPVRFDVSG